MLASELCSNLKIRLYAERKERLNCPKLVQSRRLRKRHRSHDPVIVITAFRLRLARESKHSSGWILMCARRTNRRSDTTDDATAHSRLLTALDRMTTTSMRPGGAILFRQGENPGGVFILRKGRVRLLLHTSDGQHTYRIVGPGHVLGLPATITDQPYSLTAKALEECELAVVDGKRVMNLLRHRNDLTLDVVAILAEEVRRVRNRTRMLMSAPSSGSLQ